MKSKSLIFVCLCLSLFVFAIPSVGTAAPKAIKLIFNSPWPPPPSSFGAGIERFMNELEKRTNGRVKFDRHWAGALGTAPDTLEILKTGVIDLGPICWLYNPGLTPLGTLDWAVPFTTADVWISNQVKKELYDRVPAFREEFKKNNLVPFFWYTHSSYELFTNFPVNTLTDFKGKKIGAGGTYLPKYMTAAGATPVAWVSAEVYMMMEKNVVQGGCYTLDAMTDNKAYEVTKYAIEVGLGAVTVAVFCFNRDSFNRLPKDIQDLVMEIGKETSAFHCNLLKTKAPALKKQWMGRGIEFIKLSDAEKEKWMDAMPDVPGGWAKQMEAKGLPGWEMMKTYVRLIQDKSHRFPKLWDWAK